MALVGVAVRRGDEPDVDLDLLNAADPEERTRLQSPQQFRLKLRRHLHDFI